jgi:uncharacterized phage-associated protein
VVLIWKYFALSDKKLLFSTDKRQKTEGQMSGHRVEAIANEFIRRAQSEGLPVTNMQLQKLPYIAHGWGLVLLGCKLLNENPLTYAYGPVFPRLYQALKRYGSGEVKDVIRENDGNTVAFIGGHRGDVVTESLDVNEIRLLDAVWNAYKKYSAFQLSAMTHQPDSPWTVTMEKDGLNSVISDAVIKPHFQQLLDRRKGATF